MPFKENDLFRGVANEDLNACVGDNGGPYDLYDYAQGYFTATKLLLANVKGGDVLLDIIVYPICFNFRHAVELFIKYAITDLAKATQSNHKFKNKHTLERNWRAAKRLLMKINPSAEDMAYFDKVVCAIEEVDPNGQIFRYPESIKGSRHLEDWSVINLAVIESHNQETSGIAHRWHHGIEGVLQSSRER